MNLILVIGMTGQGKSPYILDLIKGKKCFVFDVNNEYGTRTKYPGQTPVNLSDNVADERARFTEMDKRRFIELCMTKTDTICVLEDATAFLRGAQEEKTMLMITRKLFNRNNYVLVFHSINRVPPFFMELTNYVVLFKTNDEISNVERKYKSLLPAFLELQKAPKGSIKLIKLIEQ